MWEHRPIAIHCWWFVCGLVMNKLQAVWWGWDYLISEVDDESRPMLHAFLQLGH
jgi:hypothetical protein